MAPKVPRRYEQAQVGGDAQRHDGMIQDAVQGQAKELAQGELALAALPLVAIIGNADLVESEGGDGAAQVRLVIVRRI